MWFSIKHPDGNIWMIAQSKDYSHDKCIPALLGGESTLKHIRSQMASPFVH